MALNTVIFFESVKSLVQCDYTKNELRNYKQRNMDEERS